MEEGVEEEVEEEERVCGVSEFGLVKNQRKNVVFVVCRGLLCVVVVGVGVWERGGSVVGEGLRTCV